MKKKPFSQKVNSSAYNELKKQLDQAKRELSILYELSQGMQTTLDLHDILHSILTGVTSKSGLGFNRAVLFLVNPKERCLEAKMAISPEPIKDSKKIWDYTLPTKQKNKTNTGKNKLSQPIYEAIKNLHISLENNPDNLLASTFHQGSSKLISKDDITGYTNDPFLKIFYTDELVIMPLKAKNKVKGIIIADNYETDKKIAPEDLKIFTMLSNQAGLAIENSQLYELVIHKSHTDPITHLWNHGFFQRQLDSELETAKKNQTPLSLIMLDIDDFKKINDTHGHQYGDLVLKEIANTIKDSFRAIDYPCRYGGEEFSIILPKTNSQQCFHIAERLRKKIEGLLFKNQIDDTKVKITVSIGIVSYLDDQTTKEELIARADRAMYISKFNGKNQTTIGK